MHNGFTKKINLFESKRFKDRRCTFKNTGSIHLNFCQGIQNGQGADCCCWKHKSTSRNCSLVRMPKKFSIPQKVSAPRCIKSYILMETISAFFLRTSIIDIQTERRLFPIFHCSFHKSFISIASSFILSRPQNKQDHTFCLDKGDLVIKTLQEDKKSCTINFLRQGISRHSS